MADSVASKVLHWLRAGYPQGIPQNDYIALFGILHRTLTHEEVETIADQLYRERVGEEPTPERIKARIRELIHEEPDEPEVRRVSARLAAGGWPLAAPETAETKD